MNLIDQLAKLKGRPILLSIFGWLLFPGMYLIVGLLTAFDLPVETSFLIASPFGVIGFCCWVAAFMVCLIWLFKAKNIAISIGGLASSFVPLAFLGFGFWVAVNGGV